MIKLPRTANAAPCRQPPAHEGSSPDDVLRGPLRTKPRRPPITAPEGHAQDIVVLLQTAWFGPLNKSKAAALFTPPPPEEEAAPPLPRPRRGRHQQQRRVDGSDASPSTSSHSAGSSTRVVGRAGSASAVAQGPAPSLPIGPSRQQQQAAAIQDLPGIGTWAGRYRLFGQQQAEALSGGAASQRPPLAQHIAVEEEVEEVDGEDDRFGSPVVLRPGGYGRPAAEERHAPHTRYGSEEAQEDVWRWRFSRKWATEQKRYHEAPGEPASLVSDDLDAMEFTQACGMGLNLQVMPTARHALKAAAASTEEEGALGIEHSASTLSLCQFDVDQSATTMGLLSAEMSPCNSTHGAIAAGRLLQRTGSNAGSGSHRQQHAPQGAASQLTSPRLPSATKSVLSMASKAQELLRRQGAIEQEVQDRWEQGCTYGDAWAGRRLRGVHIDMWGRFKYCILRVSDGAGRTRFLVRGRAGMSPAGLLEAVSQEAAAASRAGGLPAATVEVVGAGIMEWREDTERELHLMPTTLPADLDAARGATPDSPTKSPYLGDVSGLTASLVRQALPCHFRITTGASASRGPSVAALGNRV